MIETLYFLVSFYLGMTACIVPFCGGEAEKEYVQIKGITGQSVITYKLSRVDCFARSSASQRAAAAAAHQLLFIMSGPKPTSAVHNFIVDILNFFFNLFLD